MVSSKKQSGEIQQQVSDMADNFKLQANVSGAAGMLSGFQDIAQLIIGIIAYGIVIGIGVFTGIDICYLAFPILRTKGEEVKQSGNNFMTKTDKSGNTSLRWVSDDAQYAMQVCTIESGKSPWAVYGKRRVGSIILVSVILYLLITGNITIIVKIVLNFIGGIMSALNNLAGK
jgi:hypothetical protein